MNGVIATEDDARIIRRKISRITGERVKCHHNFTTPIERIGAYFALFVIGIGAFGYALKSKRERNEKLAIGTIGIIAIAGAIIAYAKLQNEKNQLAEETARKIKRDLERSSDHRVTIVLHSQGADIGSRMFKDFTPNERKRIRVITLGGMVSIPNHYAAKVINFRFENDYVSTGAQFIFDKMSNGGGKITHLACPKKQGNAHEAESYIAHRDIRKALRAE
jgi:hypothetical protein